MSLRYPTPDDDDDEDNEALGLFDQAKDTVLKPYHIATSKPARRAYLTTFLVILASLLLLGLAVIAYSLFYWNYIPRIGFSRTVHLQFDNVFPTSHSRFDESANPYGTVEVGSDIVSGQRYDIRVVLELPRTRENRDAGNFMVEAGLYATGAGILDEVKEGLAPGLAEKDNRLALSRRPGILAYRSWPLEWMTRLLQLPWYLLGWRRESEVLTVGLWEALEFERGWRNIPSNMRIELQSIGRMQVYSAKVEWRARFRGLRWVMYNHRIISAMVFITLFWTTEMAFAGLAWAGLSLWLQSPAPPAQEIVKIGGEDGKKIKQESASDDGRRLEMSDTERTFPSSSKQQALRYQSPKEEEGPKIKQEEEDVPTRTAEADDEEDEDVDFVDSGLGTSMESSAARRDSVRRRRARAEREED